jgi:hypothetical protein
MPWVVGCAWRYLATSAAIALGLQGLPALLDRLPLAPIREAVASTAVLEATAPVRHLASRAVPGSGALQDPAVLAVLTGVVVALGPILPVLLWHRLARIPIGPQLTVVAEADARRPYVRDIHARLVVDRRGYLFGRRVLFLATGIGWRSLRDLPRDYDQRHLRPVAIHRAGGWTWWIAGNEFYRVTSSYHRDTVQAVVEALRWRRRPRLDVGLPVPATEDRREDILRTLVRPSLGRHNGLVCVRCRDVIDPRDAAAAPLWTEVGLRAVDVQLVCRPCRAETSTGAASKTPIEVEWLARSSG